MSRKGVSYDEKLRRALAFFWEKKTVFNLKELERMLYKEKGIVSMAVKDVIQILVDDEKVDCDKIGIGNFYWAFPSKALRNRQNKLEKVQTSLADAQEKNKSLQSKKRKLEEGREETNERAAKLARLSDLKRQIKELDKGIADYSRKDPKKLEEIHQRTDQCFDASDRWTDNIFNLISYCKKLRPDYSEAQLYKYFEIPDELDYIDRKAPPPKKKK